MRPRLVGEKKLGKMGKSDKVGFNYPGMVAAEFLPL
jgi:hypothetical protein